MLRLSCPRQAGSSRSGDGTRVPCIGRRPLTTRLLGESSFFLTEAYLVLFDCSSCLEAIPPCHSLGLIMLINNWTS